MPSNVHFLQKTRFQLAIILLLPLLFYANSLSNDYNLDDEFIIRNHQLVHGGIASIPALFRSSFNSGEQSKDYGYRPIPLVTAAIEYQFFGQKPVVSHAVSLGLYIVTLFLLYTFLQTAIGSRYPLLPFLTVLFFALHPVHTEVVNNVKCRDQLCALLFAVVAWHSSLSASLHGSKKSLAIAFVAAMLSMLSNPTAVVMLATIPLWLYFFGKVSWKNFFFFVLTFLALYVSYKLLVEVIKNKTINAKNESFFWENPLYIVRDIWLRLGVGFGALWQYLRLLFVPYPLRYYYGFNQIPLVSFWSFVPLLSAALHLGIGLIALWHWRGKTLIGFIAAYYLLTVLPFSNLLKPGPGIVAERWIYAGSLAIALLTAYGVWQLIQQNKAKQQPYAFVSSVAIALCLLTTYSWIIVTRTPNWRNLETLALHDLAYLPNSVKAYAAAAEVLMPKYLRNKDNAVLTQQIKGYLEKVIALDSTYAEPHNNLALLYENAKDTATAIRYYQKAIELRGYKSPTSVTNLANIYHKQKKNDEIIQMYRKCIGADSTQLEPYINLARILSMTNQPQEALRINEKALQRFPKNAAIIHDNTARIYYENGDKASAIKSWEAAYSVDTTDAAASFKLYNVYKEIGNAEKAQYYEQTFRRHNNKKKSK